MRFLAPIFIRTHEFHALKFGLRKRASPILVSVAYHGVVPFVPIRVNSIRSFKLDLQFLGNPYSLLYLDQLRSCTFRHVFQASGTYDEPASQTPLVGYSTQLDQYLLKPITIRLAVQPGDILLCARETPRIEPELV